MNDYLNQLARECYGLWLIEAPDSPLEDTVKKYAGWLPPNNCDEILASAQRIAENEAFKSAYGRLPTRIDGEIQIPHGQ